MSKRAAFSVVEVMIAVAVLLDIMLIAIPSFFRARQAAQNARFCSDLRAAVGAFEMYASDYNHYPPETPTSIVPAGMADYLRGVDFTGRATIAGRWDWDHNRDGFIAAVVVVLEREDDVRMADIDRRIDDGGLATGSFRKGADLRFLYIIE